MKHSLKLRIIFFIYIAVVIKVIILKYPLDYLVTIAGTWEREVILEGLDTANFIPFKTIKMYINYSYMLNSFENLAGNIIVFIPFGFLLPCIKESYCRFFSLLCNAFLFAAGIEIFQLFSAFGAFDVDDIILNCFGAILGLICYRKWQQMMLKKKNSRTYSE